jgi:hypothetical protein
MVAFSKNPLSKNQPRYSRSVRPLKTFFFNTSFLEIVFILLFFSVSLSFAQETKATSTISNAPTSAVSNDSMSVVSNDSTTVISNNSVSVVSNDSSSVTSKASTSSAASSTASADFKKAASEYADNSRFSFFIQPGISFLGFDDREKFQSAIDSIYLDYKAEAVNNAESLAVVKQDFQKVNFTFPISGGIQFQHYKDHFISSGIGFIYNRESVVLSDRNNKAFNYYYTLQAVPLFLEYRMSIPSKFITLSDKPLFSVAFRWYWMLPGTEIYSTWGKIEAERSIAGNGFGLSLGYLIASWNSIRIYGDLGLTSISVSSKEPFSSIVPDASTEKAKWDLGGIQLQIRFSWGAILIKES